MPIKPGMSGGKKALIAGAVLVSVAVVAGGGFLALSRGGEPAAADQTVTVTTTPTVTATPEPTPEPTVEAPAEPAPAVGAGNSSLAGNPAAAKGNNAYCRDLKAAGWSYSAAVDYWYAHGSPDRMDADKNGIPCETVYSAASVKSIFPAYSGVGSGADEGVWAGVPDGLLCKDLKARGFNYADSVSYWYDQGMPDRMDADKNGIPCETVYSESAVAAYWH